MGLDMYLSASRYVSGWDHTTDAEKAKFALLLQAADLTRSDVAEHSPSGEVSIKVGYWRKANAIHGWFVAHVQGGDDKCEPHNVSTNQLKALLETCQRVKADHSLAETLLPPQAGFFFGGTGIDEGYFDDIEDTIAICEHCLTEKFKLFDFEYQSSW